MLTNDTRRGIRQYFFAEDGRHLLYLQDVGGNENFHLYAVPLAGGEARDLTPHEGVRAQARGPGQGPPRRGWSWP